MKQISVGEETLMLHLRADNLPEPVREYRFDSERRWRFDFAWPNLLVAVEVEGGTRASGRHNRHAGFEADCEKYNHAVLAGWRVLRFTTEQVKSGWALNLIGELLGYMQEMRDAVDALELSGAKEAGEVH